jgi:hypothetical protein
MPAEPLTFDAEHYFIVGNRGDPIVTCRPCRGIPNPSLLVFKESETYELFGYDRASFGVRLIDPYFGIAGPMLAAAFNGVVFGWSLDGPRAWDNGPSADLGVPLDIGAPEPADLVAMGALRRGWAEVHPETRSILFAFPNESDTLTRVYQLHLRYPTEPRWSYSEYGKRLYCAALFQTARTTAGPAGCPTADSEVVASTYVTLTYTNVGNRGDEMLEVWLKAAGGSWYRATTVAAGAPAASDDVLVEDLIPDKAYDWALRYELNGIYNTGAEDSGDPSAWPVASVDAFTTDAEEAAPLSFAAGDQGAPFLYGRKWYCEQAFSWSGVLDYPWELWVAIGSSSIGDASLLKVGSSGAATTETRLIGALEYYYWLRYSLPQSEFTTPAVGPIVYTGAS